jgi:hypothetical protein
LTVLLMAGLSVHPMRPVVETAFAAPIGRPGLIAPLARHHRMLAGGIESLFTFCFGAETTLRAVLRVIASAVARLSLTYLLFPVSHDDAVIVLRMLEIILCQDRIAGRLGVPGQRHVFLGNMSGGAAQLHIGTVALETPRQRVLAFALLIILIVAAAASAVLLSLPHGLRSQPFQLFIV